LFAFSPIPWNFHSQSLLDKSNNDFSVLCAYLAKLYRWETLKSYQRPSQNLSFTFQPQVLFDLQLQDELAAQIHRVESCHRDGCLFAASDGAAFSSSHSNCQSTATPGQRHLLANRDSFTHANRTNHQSDPWLAGLLAAGRL
jgi:hypothetical protein